jgi:hypothetical protein
MSTHQDNGPSQNTVEKASQPFTEEMLASRMRETLFADEQVTEQFDSENSNEVQTEDKFDETANAVEEIEPQAEDGIVPSQEDSVETEEEVPRGVQKRIDKLTAFRKQAEEQVEELKKQVNELRSKVETAEQEKQEAPQTNKAFSGDNPFSHLQSNAEINQELETARYLRFKCEENPEGFSVGDNYYDADQVRALKVNALKAIEIHLPKQKMFIDTRAQIEPLAEQNYPWWKNQGSKEYQLANQVLKAYPDFKKFPDYKLFVGDYVRGFIARETAALQGKRQTSQAPNIGIRPTSSPVRGKQSDIAARSTKARFLKTGSEVDLASYLMSSELI